MPLEVDDTLRVEHALRPSDTSDSGLYGVDTDSAKGDNAFESLIHDKKEEILRLSIRGFNFRRSRYTGVEDIVILPAGHRKVVIQLLDNLDSPPDRKGAHQLVIDLENVALDLQYIYSITTRLACNFREHGNGLRYFLEFKTLQDVFKFQEVFTGFSVQTHIPHVLVRSRPLRRQGKPHPTILRTAIQLWRKIPNQYESFNVTTDAPHNQPHVGNAEEGRARSEYVGSSTEIDPKTAPNMILDLSDGSAMETPASSFLVFGDRNRSDIISIPLDEKIAINGQCKCREYTKSCKHITLVEDDENTSSQQTSFFQNTPAGRSVSRGLPTALGLNTTASSITVSRSSNIAGTIIKRPEWMQLEFFNKEDKTVFETVFDALKHQHGPHFKEEKLRPDHQSSKEQGSLTRIHESAAVDLGNFISVVAQKSANTETKPIYEAEAGHADSLGYFPQSLPGYSSSHHDKRPDLLAYLGTGFDGRHESYYLDRMDVGARVNNRDESSYRSDAWLRNTIGPSIEGETTQPSLVRHKAILNDDRRSKEGSKITSFSTPTFETDTAPVSSCIGSEVSASSITETSGCEKQGSTYETLVNRKIRRASIETSAKQEQWRRRICRRIVVFMLWKREQDVGPPDEFWSSPASFEFINVLEVSPFDKIKGFLETYSGMEWDWWPFNPPAKPLESGKVRIRWRCACGDQRWTDTSKYLARKCQALVSENTTAGHERGNAASQTAVSAASHSQLGSVIPGSFPSDTSQSTRDTSNSCSTAQASHIQNTHNSSHSKDLYVLLCIYQESRILHSQILASKCQNDEAFFENLRQEYRRLRGFFRFWFSPLQFSHCDFVRFTRFYVNELANVGHSLPIDLIYQYNPRPPGPHEDPPISPHEFHRRFYAQLTNPCGRDEALERIPKRQKRFQINLHVDGREDMWGLHVELRPCFLIVLMWQIIITAGGWAFMGWWLSRHQGDLQNAAMPVTVIVTAMMALWAPIGKGMRETL